MRMVPRALNCALFVVSFGVLSCGGDELLLPAEGEPATLAIVDGDGQTGPIGGQLANPLVVRVTDTRGRPVAGVSVAFSPAAGTAAPETATTDADGLAITQWSLGPATGSQELNVTVPSSSPPLAVRFTATASAGAARGLIIVSGNGQVAPAGSTLPLPLVVRLLDGSGNPIGGGAVSWVVGQGGGSVEPATSTTGPDGTASATWRLGQALGANTLTAVVSGVGTVQFSATGTAGAATRLLLNGGNNQSAAAQSRLPSPISVKAVDANGNGVAGVALAWAVTAGGGSLSSSTSTTRADGTSEVTWTLGATVGAQTATATASGLQGSPVTFTATATGAPPPPPPPTPDPGRSSVSANPTSFVAGSGSSTITVTVRDAQGTPLSGVTVQLAVSGSGNTITQPSATNSSGVATGSFTSTVAESKTVSATAGGVTIQQTATVAVTAPPPPPPPTPDAGRSSVSADPTSFVAGSGSSTITVTVRDAQGTPLSGVTVQLAVSGSGNTITQPSATNSSGVATGSFTSTAAESKTVSATADGVTIQQAATVTVNPPPPPTSDASQTTAEVPNGVVGTATPITVQARDASGTARTSGGDAVAISVSGSNSATPAVTDNGNGTYSASYVPQLAGVDQVAITLGGVPIGGSPYQSTVVAPGS